VELRKNKKDDMLSKRRNVGPEEDQALSPLQENKNVAALLSIEEIQNGIQGSNPHQQLQVKSARVSSMFDPEPCRRPSPPGRS
jgi:hypothetical protein